ncbi:cation:proton antiporter [Thauera sp. SDU_THAU2]|uniref:cation:proton antiporter n=1 Tax=Thauera sp. SDU_THAU2 TaxID=3136633 RepID=UPI00311E5134
MHTVETVLLVLMLGALTGITARYLSAIPLPLIQIGLGTLLAWPQQGLHIAFDPELFLLLFIPPLLFADGWRIPKREFFSLYKPILKLAFGLVLFTVLGLGYLIHWLIPEMPLTVAFALAAVVSPTDAVAVSAITRNLGMPSKTMHVLEGESLLNDASGLVALKFAIAATLTGLFSWSEAGKEFLWMAVGGLAAGVLIGWGFAVARDTVTRKLGDVAATQMVLLLVLLPFAAYIVGERIGVSGILAAVAAGITTNFADLNRSEFITERMQTEGTWTLVESAFNGAIFLLLGLQLPSIIGTTLEQAGEHWWVPIGQVAAISLALLLMRWLWLSTGVHTSLWRAHAEGKLAEKTVTAADPGDHAGRHPRRGDAGRRAVGAAAAERRQPFPRAQPAGFPRHRHHPVHAADRQHRPAAGIAAHAAERRTRIDAGRTQGPAGRLQGSDRQHGAGQDPGRHRRSSMARAIPGIRRPPDPGIPQAHRPARRRRPSGNARGTGRGTRRNPPAPPALRRRTGAAAGGAARRTQRALRRTARPPDQRRIAAQPGRRTRSDGGRTAQAPRRRPSRRQNGGERGGVLDAIAGDRPPLTQSLSRLFPTCPYSVSSTKPPPCAAATGLDGPPHCPASPTKPVPGCCRAMAHAVRRGSHSLPNCRPATPRVNPCCSNKISATLSTQHASCCVRNTWGELKNRWSDHGEWGLASGSPSLSGR